MSLVPRLEPPVEPDRDTARRWALEELSGAEYQEAEPTLVERALEWLRGFLDELFTAESGLDSGLGLAVGVIVVLAAVAIALLVTGPLRRTARVRRRPGVLAESTATAAEHRRRALAAAAAGRWSEAVQERFRAAARTLEERTVLEPRPGRTADEVAWEAGAQLPTVAQLLRQAALVFDDVTYGERPGTEAGYQRVTAADEAARTTPLAALVPAGSGATT